MNKKQRGETPKSPKRATQTDKKFGTFGGVFTPSILTILGVIMYMRLPWIVGQAGLYVTLGIILAAHLISVTTGLSVSSIATDKKVEAGGAYYIVSRSMGLSMGGTIGIALFVGLSFSISLYIIGFTESALDYFAIPKSLHAIRVWGTVTLLCLTAITFISTSLAIKTQYLILAVIAASLASIFAGTWEVPPVAPHLHAYEGGEAATVLFGIFFPAVTGFTAGVNMSGDLRDPKRSIPIGTVVAIAVGMIVYLGLATFMAFRVPADALRNDPSVLLKLAWSPRAVIAGVWGATLSSAIGSILGAPRILQALSLDKITPKFLGIGAGPTREPRYALFVAFAIGEAGILIGELDAIARIVSVFFLATYGFLNLSASFEMIASPDFRPQFRIPRLVPVVGAIATAVLMIWLDLAAMLGAVAVMSTLFVLLKRRELVLDTGDALLGMWFSVTRSALHRLSRRKVHQRNWVPNILTFTHVDAATRMPLLEFGHLLTRQRGVFNELALSIPSDDPTVTYEQRSDTGATADAEQLAEQFRGFFSRRITVPRGRLFETMSAATSFHGVEGLRHNTVMVDWHEHASELEPFARFLNLVGELDLNVICLGYEGKMGFAKHRRIDFWWSARAGNLNLYLALMRFITATDEWEDAEIRFFLIADRTEQVDGLHKRATMAAEEARVRLLVKVVNDEVEQRSDDEWIAQYSAEADFTVVGIPQHTLGSEDILRLERLGRSIGAILFVRASSQFQKEAGAISAPIPLLNVDTGVHDMEIPSLVVSPCAAIAAQATHFSEVHSALATEMAEALIEFGAEARSSLLLAISEAVEQQYENFRRVAGNVREAGRELALIRIAERLLRKVDQQLTEYARDTILSQQGKAERGIEHLLTEMYDLDGTIPLRISVRRPKSDFLPSSNDPPPLRRLKTRRRLRAWLGRGSAPCGVSPRLLARYYAWHETIELCRGALSEGALRSSPFRDDIQHFLRELNGSLTRLRRCSALAPETVTQEGLQLLQHLARRREVQEEGAKQQVGNFILTARTLQQAYANDLDRLDADRVTRRSRRLRRADRYLPRQLKALPGQWAAAEVVALNGSRLAVQLSIVQGQLSLAVRHTTHSLQKGLNQGVRASCAELGAMLDVFQQHVAAGEIAELRLNLLPPAKFFDIQPLADMLRQSVQRATSSLPESQMLLRDASLQTLTTDPFIEVEQREVQVRQLVQVAVDALLMGPASEIMQELPRAERQAQAVMADVVRLVSFNLSALAASGREDITELQAVLEPVVENGRARVAAELDRLVALEAAVETRLNETLQTVLDRLDSYAIRASIEGFEDAKDRHQVSRLSGMAQVAARTKRGAARALVSLAYRESEGVLLARRLQATKHVGGHVDSVLGLVDALSPRASIHESLPFYYRQLFLGNTSTPSAFWVGRTAELSEIERAIRRHERGFSGPIVVTGEPGSGKTALIDVALDRYLPGSNVYRVSPPPGGSVSLDVFADGLRRAFSLSGTPHELMQALPSSSVVVLSDLELWWERSDQGHVVLEHLLELIAANSPRCLFLLEVGLAPLRFMRHFLALGGEALAKVECGPVDAKAIKDIVTLRHKSTGLRYMLGNSEESSLSELARARLFTAHFHRSSGNIGAALRSWIAGITAFEDPRLQISMPSILDDEPMDELPAACLALLVQLELHKRLTPERFVALSEESEHAIQADLAHLRRMGLVGQVRRDLIEIAPAARYLVHRYLKHRGLLP